MCCSPLTLRGYRLAFEETEKEKAAEIDRRDKELAKQAAALEEIERKRAEEERQKALTRTWRDGTGRFSVTGVLIEVLPGPKAKIKREDGVTIEIYVSKLSSADRIWIMREGEALLRSQEK